MSATNISLIALKIEDTIIRGLKKNLKEKQVLLSFSSSSHSTDGEYLDDLLEYSTDTQRSGRRSTQGEFISGLYDKFISVFSCSCVRNNRRDPVVRKSSIKSIPTLNIRVENESTFNSSAYSSEGNLTPSMVDYQYVSPSEISDPISTKTKSETNSPNDCVEMREINTENISTNIKPDCVFNNPIEVTQDKEEVQQLTCRPVSNKIESLISKLYKPEGMHIEHIYDHVLVSSSIQSDIHEDSSTSKTPLIRNTNEVNLGNSYSESQDDYLEDALFTSEEYVFANKSEINDIFSDSKDQSTYSDDLLDILTETEDRGISNLPVDIPDDDIRMVSSLNTTLQSVDTNYDDNFTLPRMFSFQALRNFYNDLN